MPNWVEFVGVRPGRLAWAAAGALLCVLGALALGLWATLPNLHWYALLRRPSFRLPNLALGATWVVVHCTMLWALIRVLRAPDWMPDRAAAIQAFFRQLAIHAVWPVVVFGLHRPKLGLGVAAALLLQLVWAMRLFGRVDRWAGALALPALAWTIYVSLLNLSVAIRN